VVVVGVGILGTACVRLGFDTTTDGPAGGRLPEVSASRESPIADAALRDRASVDRPAAGDGPTAATDRPGSDQDTAPAVAITSPAPASYINAAGVKAFKVGGTCSSSGQPVIVSTPGGNATTSCVAGGWTATLDVSALPEGPVTITATHPGSSPSPATASRQFVKDVTPPSVIASVRDGSFVSSLTAHPKIEWDASVDGGSGIERYEYCLGSQGVIDGIRSWTGVGTALQVSITGGLTLVEGRLYKASVRAIDKAGNIGPSTTADGWIPDLVTSGLVAHWTFDKDDVTSSSAADASGNGNVALLRNAPGLVAGRLGQAINLNGTNQYLDIADSPSLRTTSVTVSAWVQLPSGIAACPGGWCMIFEHARDTSNWYCLLKSATSPYDFWHWRWQSGSWGPTATEFGNTIAGHRAVVGAWMHLVAQIEPGAPIRVITYVNNGPDISYPPPSQPVTAPVPAAGPSSIGRAANLTEYFKGYIDDLRVYSRVLSAAEVDKLYNLGLR